MAQAKTKSKSASAKPPGGKKTGKPRKPKVRSLRPQDLNAVVAIDKAWVGRSRRGFFEKRLEAVQNTPDSYITLGVEDDGALAGYVIARLERGEFGGDRLVAALDAIGVARDSQNRGLGDALMKGLDDALRKATVSVLYSQTDWDNRALLDFFARHDFALAPHVLLESSIAEKG